MQTLPLLPDNRWSLIIQSLDKYSRTRVSLTHRQIHFTINSHVSCLRVHFSPPCSHSYGCGQYCAYDTLTLGNLRAFCNLTELVCLDLMPPADLIDAIVEHLPRLVALTCAAELLSHETRSTTPLNIKRLTIPASEDDYIIRTPLPNLEELTYPYQFTRSNLHLLTPKLKKLEGPICLSDCTEVVDLDILERAPNLEWLDLNIETDDWPKTNNLHKFTSLRHLSIATDNPYLVDTTIGLTCLRNVTFIVTARVLPILLTWELLSHKPSIQLTFRDDIELGELDPYFDQLLEDFGRKLIAFKCRSTNWAPLDRTISSFSYVRRLWLTDEIESEICLPFLEVFKYLPTEPLSSLESHCLAYLLRGSPLLHTLEVSNFLAPSLDIDPIWSSLVCPSLTKFSLNHGALFTDGPIDIDAQSRQVLADHDMQILARHPSAFLALQVIELHDLDLLASATRSLSTFISYLPHIKELEYRHSRVSFDGYQCLFDLFINKPTLLRCVGPCFSYNLLHAGDCEVNNDDWGYYGDYDMFADMHHSDPSYRYYIYAWTTQRPDPVSFVQHQTQPHLDCKRIFLRDQHGGVVVYYRIPRLDAMIPPHVSSTL